MDGREWTDGWLIGRGWMDRIREMVSLKGRKKGWIDGHMVGWKGMDLLMVEGMDDG